MRALILSLVLALVYSPSMSHAAADKWQIADFGTTDPNRLGDIAFNSYSDGVKARIRSYLVATVPDSAEGLLASGWLKNEDGDKKGAIDAYRLCSQKYPNALRCWSNIATVTEDVDEKQKSLEVVLQQDPSFVDYSAVRRLYFLLLDERKNTNAARAFLAQQEQAYPNHAVFDYIRGLEALNNERNNEKAALYFRKAIAKAQLKRPEIVERLIDLETGPLFEGSGDRLAVGLSIVGDYYETNSIKNRAPLYYLLKRFTNDPYTWGKRGLILALAWGTTGKGGAAEWEPEILDYLSPTLWASSEGLADRVLSEVQPRAHSSQQLTWLGQILTNQDPSGSGPSLSWEGIANAYTEKQRLREMNYLMNDLEVFNRCDIADRYAKQYLKVYPVKAAFFSQYFEINLCTADLDAAQDSLNQRRKYGEGDGAALRNDELRLAIARAERNNSVIPEAERQVAKVPETNTLALSPDGRFLAFGISPVRLADTKTRQLIANLGDGTRYRFTPDGKYLVVMGAGGLAVREIATGKVVGKAAHFDTQNFRDFAINPDGNQLAATDYRGFLYRYRLPSLTLEKVQRINEQPIGAYVAWIKQGDIVTASADESVMRRWDAKTLAFHPDAQSADGLLHGPNWVHVLQVSPSGRYLVAADNTSTLHVWDMQNPKAWKHRAVSASFAGQLAFSPDETSVIANQWNGSGQAAVVALDSLSIAMIREGINAHHAFSPDGKIVYRADSGVAELDADTMQVIRSWDAEPGNQSIAAFPSLGAFAISDAEATTFFEMTSGKPLRTVEAKLDLTGLGVSGQFAGNVENGAQAFYDYQNDKLTPVPMLTGNFDVSSQHAVRVTEDENSPGQYKLEFFRLGEPAPFAEQSISAVTEDLEYGNAPNSIDFSSVMDRGGRYWVIRTSWKDGFGHGSIYSRWVNVFDVTTGKLAKRFQLPNGVRYIATDVSRPSGVLLKMKNSAVALDFASMSLGATKPLSLGEYPVYEDSDIDVSYQEQGVRVTSKKDGKSQIILPEYGARISGAAYLPLERALLLLHKSGRVQKVPVAQ